VKENKSRGKNERRIDWRKKGKSRKKKKGEQ